MIKWLPVLIVFCLISVFCLGQVKSGAYKSMLKNLLKHTVPEMSVQDAKSADTAVFLDAREMKEYEVSHIKGGIPVGYDHFEMSSLPPMPKDTSIIVYCSVGFRSEKVAEQLLKNGYTNVSNLYGGIFEWVNEDQPVSDERGVTNRVHAYSRTWGVWLKKGKKVY